MASKLPTGVFLRGAVYWLRVTLPEDLRPLYPRTARGTLATDRHRASLGTTDKAEARIKALEIRATFEREFQEKRRGLVAPKVTQVTLAMREVIAQAVYSAELRADAEQRRDKHYTTRAAQGAQVVSIDVSSFDPENFDAAALVMAAMVSEVILIEMGLHLSASAFFDLCKMQDECGYGTLIGHHFGGFVLMKSTDLLKSNTKHELIVQLQDLLSRGVTYPEDWDPAVNGPEDRRPGERVKREKELFSISRLVSCLAEEHYRFPFVLTQRERPDFSIQAGDLLIGVEHTEATDQLDSHKRRVRADMEKRGETLSPYWFLQQPTEKLSPGETRRPLSRSEIEQSIRCDEPGDGWAGRTAERQWANGIANAVSRKLLKAEGYEQFEQNWLLIYDNLPLPSVDLHIAQNALIDELDLQAVHDRFDSVFILLDRQVLALTQGRFQSLRVTE